MTQCNYCEKSDALMTCGRCRIVYYRNKDCQTSDWKKSHKKKCGKSKEDLMAEQILEDNMSLKQVKELDLLMNMMASSDSSNTPKALKMKNMMSIYARVPDLVSEFAQYMRNREMKDLFSREAERLLESVAVNYRTCSTFELIFYKEAPTHPLLDSPHTLFKVLNSNDKRKINWYIDAPLYDVFINEFVEPYVDGIYHSFSNCQATKEILHSGTTHVAVGFVDLSILLWMRLKETGRTSEPFRFAGFEKCAFNIAKTLVIVEMLKRKDDGIVDAILQVWYSSCWSDDTLALFKSSVNKVIIEKLSDNRHVCLILEEWSRCDAPSLHVARKEWLQKIDDEFFTPVVNSALKSSRNSLIEYFLTGQLLPATVGSIVMFKSPVGRSRNESCFHSLNFKDLIDATKKHKNDFVSGAISLFREGIIRLNNNVIGGLVVIKIEPPSTVSLDFPGVIEKIRCMKPYTMSWNNCLDYMSIKDFHGLAKAC